MAFITRLAGRHFNNANLPTYQIDKNINAGTKVLYDFGAPTTYGGTLPGVGTSLPLGTTFASLLKGGSIATTVTSYQTFSLIFTGTGLQCTKTNAGIVLGPESKITTPISEYLWIVWYKLGATSNDGACFGTFDGQSDGGGQWNGRTNNAVGAPFDGIIKQQCQHYKYTGGNDGIYEAFLNPANSPLNLVTSLKANNALGGNTPQPNSNGSLLQQGSYSSGGADVTLYRATLVDLTAAGLSSTQAITADFNSNNTRFV
jgi:hypothetical protein